MWTSYFKIQFVKASKKLDTIDRGMVLNFVHEAMGQFVGSSKWKIPLREAESLTRNPNLQLLRRNKEIVSKLCSVLLASKFIFHLPLFATSSALDV